MVFTDLIHIQVYFSKMCFEPYKNMGFKVMLKMITAVVTAVKNVRAEVNCWRILGPLACHHCKSKTLSNMLLSSQLTNMARGLCCFQCWISRDNYVSYIILDYIINGLKISSKQIYSAEVGVCITE